MALNFAVMRAVLAGVRGDGRLGTVERWLLQRFGGSTQMESLWRYNDKYHPIWRPRYVLLSRQANVPVQGWAIAEAEGATELPVLGRLLGQ